MAGTDRLITLDRLRGVLEAYGAEPERWPAEERAAATALIESSGEARSLFSEAAALDRMLDRLGAPQVSPGLAARVRGIETPPRLGRLGPVLTALGEWLQPGTRFAWQGAVAAAAVIGIVAGIGLSEAVLDHDMPAVRPLAAIQPAPPDVVFVSGSGDVIGALTLEQDMQVLSLTGSDGTGNGSAYAADEGETSLAAIPLY